MAFAVTYTSKESEKDHVLRLIVSHGGRLLNEGFDELFIAESLQDSTTSPKRSPSKLAGNASSTSFRLTREAQNLGFTALISDRHSRRAKYMQALALGLPCLAGRWVLDCIKQNIILTWERYLLPAGESSFLGAVRSRVLLPSPAAEARLSMMIDTRPKLLNGRSVLLVTGKGKVEEKRKAYVFLTRALGAKRVAKAANVELAKNMLEQGQQDWDLVYVDGPEKQAEKVLFGTINGEVDSIVTAGAGKKRKRGNEDEQVRRKVKIVGDEFIIQSLILGALVEQ
ncbi:hypothetical protein B0A49_03445 [Cryomyces minteri]|uniref:BRCT domain-containing protein n=1 Tax=Cryomyces minteri TaxID=331657 RepID=A0A4U0X7S7_9PEZI|nr:hypothetical protein B0A49_03445 [Cryomyces minteri]